MPITMKSVFEMNLDREDEMKATLGQGLALVAPATQFEVFPELPTELRLKIVRKLLGCFVSYIDGTLTLCLTVEVCSSWSSSPYQMRQDQTKIW
jgi:hypothetical protein